MTEETKTAKIPEGVTVETPKPTELKKLPIPDFSLDPTLPMITNPHYTNNNKTELACVLLRPDGMATQEKNIPADDKHPLYRDIKKQFSEDEIRHNTARQVQIQDKLKKADEEQQTIQERGFNFWEGQGFFGGKNKKKTIKKRSKRKGTRRR